MNIHILVLVIAIILFGLLAFKQMSALILAPLVTSFVIICSGMPILDSLKTYSCLPQQNMSQVTFWYSL